MPKCGGLSDPKPADADTQQLCDSVKVEAQQKTGKNFSVYEAHSFATQVVAGTNYFIKVHVGDGKHVHLRVFKALPHAGGDIKLHGLQEEKTLHDPIEHF
ncbi:cystatin 14a, tandem duplicate 2 [Salarias fasciatus]|uniref:Cystatin-B n=1 Tax=Salarias fasciatus TaxID=181472 RepID=A0A672G5X7_SALFA|nr:cystatin-B-like [Salarias fasciatus]